MNPTVLAMRRPVTTLMLVVALISGGALAYNRMRVDIFPALNVPKIYVFLDYIGMSPDQMEGFIVNQLELYFQYVDGIQDIDTRNIQQVALCQLSFFPGTDMGQAMAQVVAMSDRAMSWMPKGTLPPMIMRMDAGSVPVGYLVFESEITSLGAMGDLAQNVVRPLVQKFVPGTVAISPFGPNMRSIVINVDPQKLLDYNLSPQEVIEALAKGNTIIPAGNIYVKDSMPVVANNATVVDFKRLGDIPLRMEKNVYLRDVATFSGRYRHHLRLRARQRQEVGLSADHQERHGIDADRRGRRPQGDADVPRRRPQGREGQLPVRRVAHRGGGGRERGDRGVDRRGLDRAHDPLVPGRREERDRRRVQHPAGAPGVVIRALGDGQHDQHHVAGRHGAGDRHPGRRGDGDDRERARADGADAEARLGGLACEQRHGRAAALGVALHPVGVHPGVHHGRPAPVALHAADPGGRVRHDRVVPALQHVRADPVRGPAQAPRRSHGHGEAKPGLFDRFLKVYGKFVGWFVHLRWLVVPAYLGACALVLWQLGLQVGTELFPQVDSGQFVLRFRPPPGSNFELTRQMAVKCLEEIEKEAKPENIEISMGYVGQVAPNFGIDNMVLFMRGPDDGQLRVALREDSGIKLAEFRERLRKVLPERVIPWLAKRLEQGGLVGDGGRAASQVGDLRFPAGRYRDQRHELRLVDADRRPRRRHRSEDGPAACGKDRRRDETHPLPPRRPVRAGARLPQRRGHDRPRESGALRCHGRGRGSRAGHGDGVDPFRQSQLLGRREDGLRLPGPDSGARRSGWRSRKMSRPCRSSRSTRWST